MTCDPGEVLNTSNSSDAPFTYAVFKTNVVDTDLFPDSADA